MRILEIKQAKTKNDNFLYYNINQKLTLAYSTKEKQIFLDNGKGQVVDDILIGRYLMEKNLFSAYVNFKFSVDNLLKKGE